MLDEPTSRLDIHHPINLRRFVRQLGTAVIVALHDLNLVAMFRDRLCLLDLEQVRAISIPEEVLTEQNLAEVFRIEAMITRNP